MHILLDDDSSHVKTQDSDIKFGCDAKIRLMHEVEWPRICVGSFKICCSPNCDVIFSNILAWEVLLSLKYQRLILH